MNNLNFLLIIALFYVTADQPITVSSKDMENVNPSSEIDLSHPDSFFEHPLVFHDAAGNQINLAESAKGNITVLRFWSAYCPHSRSFDGEMRDLYLQYHKKAALFDINSNCHHDVDHARAIRQAADFPVPLIIDTTGMLAKAFKAETNAVFLLFDRKGGLRYRGAYTVQQSSENETKLVTIHDMVTSLLKGEPILPPYYTRGHGCVIKPCAEVIPSELPILFHGLDMVKFIKKQSETWRINFQKSTR